MFKTFLIILSCGLTQVSLAEKFGNAGKHLNANSVITEYPFLYKALGNLMPSNKKYIESISQSIKRVDLLNSSEKGLLIIGGTNPHETLYVHDTTWWHFGDIYIANYGVMLIDSAEFRNYGNIWLFNHGKLIVDSSTFGFLPIYWWQFSFGGFDSSEVQLSNSKFCYSLPLLTGGWDNLHLSFTNMQFETWLSGYFYDNAGATINNCHGYTGEYCIMDTGRGTLTISNSDTINIWLSFPNSSVANFAPLNEEFVNHWKFPDDVGATGINYSITVDSSYLRVMCEMLYNGSNVTLHDKTSHIKIRGTSTDSLTIDGLMDSTYYSDWTAPFSDRYLRLINSTAEAYSIYAVESSRVWLDNSRVSEVVCMNDSKLNMINSTNDGRAGCFWVWNNSTVYVANSLTQTETVIRGTSKLTLYNSSITDHIVYGKSNVIVENTGTLALLNSRTSQMPKLYDNAVLYYASIDSPAVASMDDSLPVYGSVYVNGGPDCDIYMNSYRLYYADSANPYNLIPVGTEHTDSVKNGILDYWDTDSLTAGGYILYLSLKDNFGDSVMTYLPVQLNTIAIAESNIVESDYNLTISQNPFITSTIINYSLPIALDRLRIAIYDISGRCVKTLVNKGQKVGNYSIKLDAADYIPGVYFVKLTFQNNNITRKLILLR